MNRKEKTVVSAGHTEVNIKVKTYEISGIEIFFIEKDLITITLEPGQEMPRVFVHSLVDVSKEELILSLNRLIAEL